MDEKKTDEVLETIEEETETAEEVNESAEEVTETAEEVNESAEEAAEDDTETAEEAAEDDTETAEEPAKFVDKHGRTVSEEEINKLARHYRHIGFAIFGGLAALLSIFLIYCVVTGYQEGKIYDPFTGENVVSE